MDYEALLRLLANAGVDFIVIGGAAATAHGSGRLTEDLDLVKERSPENIARRDKALALLNPDLRDAPADLPFKWEDATLLRGLNFTLTTSLGPLDLYGEIVLGGDYRDLIPHTVLLQVFGIQCRFLNLRRLIEVKRATGRPKDREVIAETRAARVSRSRCNRARKADARQELQCRRRSGSRDPRLRCHAGPSRKRPSIWCRRHRHWRPIPARASRENSREIIRRTRQFSQAPPGHALA